MEKVTTETFHAGCLTCDQVAGAILRELRATQVPHGRTASVIDVDGYHGATVTWELTTTAGA